MVQTHEYLIEWQTESSQNYYDIAHGDCFKFLDRIPDGRVSMVLADLPYGTTNCKWDTQLPIKELWEQYKRVCNGPIILFGQQPFTSTLILSNIKDFRYEWIWEKPMATGHLNAKTRPLKAHENILVFGNTLVYNPIKTIGHIRKVCTKIKDRTEIYGKQDVEGIHYDSTERYPRTVLKFSKDKKKLHPTQKPVALLKYLIETYTNEGDLVLDNVMGSGSTGVAAIESGRRFYGIEINGEYFDMAQNRIRRARDRHKSKMKFVD